MGWLDEFGEDKGAVQRFVGRFHLYVSELKGLLNQVGSLDHAPLPEVPMPSLNFRKQELCTTRQQGASVSLEHELKAS